MFQFARFPPTAKGGSLGMTPGGLPHSETMGSQPDSGSSILTLLVSVLRRLVVPRHPPTAHHVLPGHRSLGVADCARDRSSPFALFVTIRASESKQ